ncbi:MAG: hypothetical protein M3R30_06175 [Candidatus Eremiobacteraeota bacterium]|nr:hypothetical protein [Candidatus Eremiobacteraeota bacterium]
MTTIALRVFLVLAIFACGQAAPARAAISAPPLVVEVYAQGEGVNARVTVPNHDSQHEYLKLGDRREFEFAFGVTEYTFAISGCGKVQTKMLTFPIGHGGALITVYRGCALVITGR